MGNLPDPMRTDGVTSVPTHRHRVFRLFVLARIGRGRKPHWQMQIE